MTRSRFQLALLLAIVVIVSIPPSAVTQESGGMTATTSKGTLDIRLEPIWKENSNASFKVSFLDPGTETLHLHQDYDFRILKDGAEVFSAAKSTGQTLIHNVQGTITVDYTFRENGDYAIQVFLAGTGIAPTIPTEEEATFQIQVTPEFPAGLVGIAAAALVSSAIVLGRRVKRF